MIHPTPTVHSQRGFTLLIAALVASVVLALGVSIYQLAQHAIILSSMGRDSQFAFYAADTAAECALFWDFRCNYFATSTSAINTTDPSCAPASSSNGPTCDGHPMNVTGRPTISPYYPYTMSTPDSAGQQPLEFFQDTGTHGYCTKVSVTKTLDPSTSAVRTVIHADGYNVSCASVDTAPQALQRTVELHY